jgi:hypothetical protein
VLELLVKNRPKKDISKRSIILTSDIITIPKKVQIRSRNGSEHTLKVVHQLFQK